MGVARVAVLAAKLAVEGPQGTLFGSGAEAGVLRYITNKPKLDVTEGNVNAGYSYTAHGDPNSSVDAMINLPLIPDTLAVRAVVYDDSRGGYINNVPATFTRQGTDEGFSRYNGGVVPANSVSINNAAEVGNAINPVTYQGFRLSGLLKINDNWNALLQQSYQNMNAQGVFYEMPNGPEGLTFNCARRAGGRPPLPPLSVALFNPSYDKDKFEDTQLTVNGQAGPLKLVYSGGYLVRNVEQQQDYTNYSRGVFGYYYQCAGYSSKSAAAGQCFSPSAVWQDNESNTHQSHEFRVSTPDDARVRGIGGLYWEEFVITDQTQWLYKTVPTCSAAYNDNCFNNVQPWPGSFTTTPGEQGDNVGFFDNFKRNIIQKAAFGSVDVDLIPKTLIFTAGTRYYKFNEDEVGGDVGSFYCKNFAPTTYFGPCTSSTNGNGKPGGIGITGSAPYGTNLNRPEPQQLHVSRLSQPRQPELARHRRCAAVLHLVAGLQARRVQSRHQVHTARCERRPPVHHARHLLARYAHQQRARAGRASGSATAWKSTAPCTRRIGRTPSWNSSIRRAASAT